MRRVLALAVVAAAAVTSALAGRAADPGVSKSRILIGGTTPLSGEAATGGATARGAGAYFEYLNSHGGVRGRQIDYRYLDDAYEPARTIQATRQLVQQDGVFALFNSLGTAQNLQVRPYLNEAGVPQLFVASGATTWGRDHRKYPWTIGFIPTYRAEGIIYGQQILRTHPHARVAALYQDDEYGQDLLGGLRKGLGRRQAQLVAQQGYDPTGTDVQAQIARLKASNADTLMIFAFGKFAIQAFVYVNRLGWRPRIYVNAVAASTSVLTLASEGGSNKRTEGTISIAFFKDPADPSWRNDRGFKLYASIMRRYLPGANPKDGYYMAGMAPAYALAETLRRAGKNPTRKAAIAAASRLDLRDDPFVLPGIRIKTSPTDHFPIEQVQLQRWHAGRWLRFGKLVKAPRG